jgi:hypothetical protein
VNLDLTKPKQFAAALASVSVPTFRFTARVGGIFRETRMEHTHDVTSHDVNLHARRYSEEVKSEAVRRVAEGENRASVARSIGCHPLTLHTWLTPNPTPTNTKRHCPHCADLIAVCKLVLASADGSHELRTQVNKIVAESVARHDT